MYADANQAWIPVEAINFLNAAGVHLVAILPNLTWGSGFYPDSSKLDVVAEPLRPIEGVYVLPEAPGLGVELDEDALAHCIKN